MSAYTLHNKLSAMKDVSHSNVSSFLVFEDPAPTKSSSFEVWDENATPAAPAPKFEIFDENAENRGVIAPPRIEKAPFQSIFAPQSDFIAPVVEVTSPVDEIEEKEFKSIIPD